MNKFFTGIAKSEHSMWILRGKVTYLLQVTGF